MILMLLLMMQSTPDFSSGKYDVVVVDPIAPAWDKYVECLGKAPKDPWNAANALKRAIALCKDVKIATMAEADAALANAPDYKDSAKRQAAISNAFDGYERSRLSLFEDIQTLSKKRATDASNH